MAIVIDNIGQLRDHIMKCIDNAMFDLAKEMTDDLGKTIQSKFYDAFSPSRYSRTFQLIRAAHRPEIITTPTKVTIKVFIDFNSMKHYRYDGTPITQPTKRSGVSFTEEELALSAAAGFHGIRRGYVASVTPGKFWYEFVKKWNQYRIEHRLAVLLRKQGLTVRV